MAFWIVFLILLYLAAGFYLALDIDKESTNTKICVALFWPAIVIIFMAVFSVVMTYNVAAEIIKTITRKRGG